MYFLAASRLLAIVVLLGILQLDKCQQEDEVIVLRDTTLRIEHSLGGEVFTPRCTIRVTVKSDGKQTLQFLDRNGIFAEEVASFQDRLSKNALYKIRIQSISESNHTSPWIVSSIPSCELQKSGFKEDLSVHLDTSDNIVGVSYSSPVLGMARPCDPKMVRDAVVFQTRLKIAERFLAQAVPLQAQGPRPANLKDVNLKIDGEAAPAAQQKSFLQRYWYVVVMLIIYMLMPGAPQPVAEGQSGEAKPSAVK